MVSIMDLLTSCFQPRTRRPSLPSFKLTPPPLPVPVSVPVATAAQPAEEEKSGRYVVVGAVKANNNTAITNSVNEGDGIAVQHIRTTSEAEHVKQCLSGSLSLSECAGVVDAAGAVEEAIRSHIKCEPCEEHTVVIQEPVQEHNQEEEPIQEQRQEQEQEMEQKEKPKRCKRQKQIQIQREWTLAEALASASSDPLHTSLHEPLHLLFLNRKPTSPRPVNIDPILPQLRILFADYAQVSDKLVRCWVKVAERRVKNGINVCHLVDYFEDAILQQFL